MEWPEPKDDHCWDVLPLSTAPQQHLVMCGTAVMPHTEAPFASLLLFITQVH